MPWRTKKPDAQPSQPEAPAKSAPTELTHLTPPVLPLVRCAVCGTSVKPGRCPVDGSEVKRG